MNRNKIKRVDQVYRSLESRSAIGDIEYDCETGEFKGIEGRQQQKQAMEIMKQALQNGTATVGFDDEIDP